MQMRVIYMGTPDFAVHALVSIVEAGHDVVACFTQPDKAKGRSKKLQPTPVKVQAMEYDIPVYQPVKLREQENVDIIREYAPDVIVVPATVEDDTVCEKDFFTVSSWVHVPSKL
jgi:methionyl-tRNA formyltransferase